MLHNEDKLSVKIMLSLINWCFMNNYRAVYLFT